MFGFVIGAVSLAGLIHVARGGHRHGRGWHGGGCGGSGCHEAGCHGEAFHRGAFPGGGCPGARGKQMILHALFEHLDATPGQEKVIQKAVDSLAEKIQSKKDLHRAARSKLAQSLRGEVFDEGALQGAFDDHAGVHRELHQELTVALREIHEALDDRQRRRLADLIESGPRGLAHCFVGRIWGRRAQSCDAL